MRALRIYIAISVATILLAFAESTLQPREPMHLYGFVAVFICQPALAIIRLLIKAGIPIPDFSLSPLLVSFLCGLNILIFGFVLFFKRLINK